MITLSPDKFARLKKNSSINRKAALLLSIEIDKVWYHLTDLDTEIEYGGKTYIPGYFTEESLDEFETTSEPKTNDLNIEIYLHDGAFIPLLLNAGWLNGNVEILEHHWDEQGEILTKCGYKGFIDDFSLSEKSHTAVIKVSSVWADFERESGIRTNVESQARHYEGDTAFRHVARAERKIYWGKENPNPPTNRTTRFSPPAGR